ncbi:methyltransferase family protein [Dyella jiangningensis]|uniref:Isoprenylcysteine carboxyl methyltransferase n=1 Tax=Dyella jiangningensis TaxID=1379159 RepID=A0A328P5I9_9GAMM|nr:isoprenylcysteine carboxylmethyltransferase family protein [Dyella jiangningensis]RAO77527.1 hypothetical protein CA260_06545 [Dyella jiangningensis]
MTTPTLPSQAWRKTLLNTLVLGALLFVSAGTLRFWQAWAFTGIYVAGSCFNTAYFLRRDPSLVRRRLRAGPGAESMSSQRVIQAVSAVCLLATLLLAGLDHRWRWSGMPPAVVAVADGVVVVGLLIVFASFRSNSHAAATVGVAPAQVVASAGPYRWVRHPMYLGSALAFLATPAALGSAYAWLGAVPATWALVVRLLDEERLLKERLPGYAAYASRVRFRLLPGLW